MYQEFFSLKEQPFSISPDPDFIFLSDRHKEALAHLKYGLQSHGGFVLLTGEVGTGKTTVCRFLLQETVKNLDIAFILNPALTEIELLATICDGFKIEYQQDKISLKLLFDALAYWIKNERQERNAVVIIDEAQHLSFSVLEQLRLLTNIESHTKKSLQVILIGQTELQEKLKQSELRQLSQRIIARYHLQPLTEKETERYIQHRLSVAGATYCIFPSVVLHKVYEHSQGVPRLINLICERCLLCAYSENSHEITPKMLKSVIKEMDLGDLIKTKDLPFKIWWRFSFLLLLILLLGMQLPKILNTPFSTFFNGKTVAVTAPSASEKIKKEESILSEKSAKEAVVLSESENNKQDISSEKTIEETNILTKDTNKKEALATQEINQEEMDKEKDPSLQGELKEGVWFDDYPQLDFSQTEFAHALKNLYAIWGYQVALINANCQQGRAASLICFSEKSDIDKLRILNYPAVIKLENKDQYLYVVVYKISNTYQLIIGDQSINVSKNWLQHYWQGGLTLLWQTPFPLKKTLQLGYKGDTVKWLNNQLNKIYSRPESYKERFDLQLQQQVREFQKDNLIKADGVVGARTLMLIMQKITPQIPHLREENL